MVLVQTLPLADSWGMHGNLGWGWMMVMMMGMVLFWGAIIFGVVWLMRSATRSDSAPGREQPISKESPLEILDRRFAEGGVTFEDYRARREVLVNGGAAARNVAPGASR